MQHISCNFCGHDETEAVNQGSDLLLGIPGEFPLVRCLHCGLIYQNPQLSQAELGPHYPDNYLPYQHTGDLGARKEAILHDRAVQRFCNRVAKHSPQPGALLDVGCATGDFLYAMQQRGWRVDGVEPSTYAISQARRLVGDQLYAGGLETTTYADAAFDVITLWDVLEHLHDPKRSLMEIRRILKPGGLLVFSIPNPDCIEARLFGSAWLGWERPRHLHLIPRSLLQPYLNMVGLQFEGVESFNGRLALTLLSVEFALKARGVPERRWRRWLTNAYGMPFRLATWPLYKIAEWLNQTTIMTVFAKRPFDDALR